LPLSGSARRSTWLTGTALLAALVIVFDYALKFSGLKIPFPWMPTLKFDFTGVPIALSLFMYGLPSALTTSLVAFVGIVARSGDPISAAMKFASEFSTVLGLALGMRLANRLSPRVQKGSGLVLGIVLRVAAMSACNLVVLPLYGYPEVVAYGMLPLIAAFNVAAGAITILLATFLYEAVKRRFPTPRP
jgi:riboflavin transporter FmnP